MPARNLGGRLRRRGRAGDAARGLRDREAPRLGALRDDARREAADARDRDAPDLGLQHRLLRRDDDPRRLLPRSRRRGGARLRRGPTLELPRGHACKGRDVLRRRRIARRPALAGRPRACSAATPDRSSRQCARSSGRRCRREPDTAGVRAAARPLAVRDHPPPPLVPERRGGADDQPPLRLAGGDRGIRHEHRADDRVRRPGLHRQLHLRAGDHALVPRPPPARALRRQPRLRSRGHLPLQRPLHLRLPPDVCASRGAGVLGGRDRGLDGRLAACDRRRRPARGPGPDRCGRHLRRAAAHGADQDRRIGPLPPRCREHLHAQLAAARPARARPARQGRGEPGDPQAAARDVCRVRSRDGAGRDGRRRRLHRASPARTSGRAARRHVAPSRLHRVRRPHLRLPRHAHQAGRPPRLRLRRDRRPGAGRDQLHRPRARRRRARGRDGLPLLGHPVVARGRRARC